MSDTRIHPERLYDSLLREWNERQTVGLVIPPELEEIIRRHLQWACTMGAESVINNIIRHLELTPHSPWGKVSFKRVMELIRNADPNESDKYLRTAPRDYEIYTPDITENNPKTDNNG